MAQVTLKDIWKVYDNGYCAVKGINLSIAHGEMVVLVGPSGCGKSTTLRMIAGLEEVSSGEVFIGESNVTDTPPKDRDIAMVFQSYALYPHMTSYENMAFGLKLRGMSQQEIDTRVRIAANRVEITHLLDSKPKTLSGGQRQRVALGRAMVREPSVFLFDEPLSNLDTKLRLETRSQIKQLQKELKTTAVYVTHDQEEAMTLGDRIVVMKDGIIQQVDTPLNVYKKPANRFVAQFIGSPAMNVIEGTVLKQASGPGRFQVPDSSTFEVPPELTRNFPVGQPIACGLGFRPESCGIQPHAIAGSTLAATVRLIEPLGDRTLAHLDGPAGQPLVLSVNPETQAEPGNTWHLSVKSPDIHLFRLDIADSPRV